MHWRKNMTMSTTITIVGGRRKNNKKKAKESEKLRPHKKIQSISYFNIKVNNMIRPYSAFIVMCVCLRRNTLFSTLSRPFCARARVRACVCMCNIFIRFVIVAWNLAFFVVERAANSSLTCLSMFVDVVETRLMLAEWPVCHLLFFIYQFSII